MPPKALKLGEWMLSHHMISADQLEIALIEQRRSQTPVGQQLVRLGFVTDALLRDVLAKQHAHESIDLQHISPETSLLEKIPESFARQHQLLPIEITSDHKSLRIAMVDVFNQVAIDQIRSYVGLSLQIKPLLATAAQIEQALDRFYGHTLSLDRILQEIESGQSLLDKSSTSEEEGQPVVRLVNAILVDAVKQGASDIHFEPEMAFVRIRYRIDGVLWQIRSIHQHYWPALCVRLKILAGMDIAEQRSPQDGRVHLFLCGRQIDFRVSTQPTLHGENVVLRVLDREKSILPMEAMQLRHAQLQLLRQLIEKPEGLLILTGPTGSGKTTTLYSLLHHLNQEQVNIMTLEDPVEYPMMLIRQTSVNAANKVDFASGIRAMLRQDPDIILIGEVRDESTAAMALRAAMTGHLVMTTLHTNSAPAAFARLLDLGVSRQTLAGHLVGVIGQRLVRRLCPACKSPDLPDAKTKALLAAVMKAGCRDDYPLYKATGCEQCRMSGYRGRLAVMEILAMHPALDDLILQQATTGQLQQEARRFGYTTLAEEALHLLIMGETSLQEIRRVIDLSWISPLEHAS